MNRRDVLRLGGSFLMSTAFDGNGSSDPSSSEPPSDDGPDLWLPEGLRELERFAGRGKMARHTGPSLGEKAINSTGVQGLHDTYVMAPRHFSHPGMTELVDSLVCEGLSFSLSRFNFDWCRQRMALARIVGQFARIGRSPDYDFGSFCLCYIWPGGQFRKNLEDGRLYVERRVEVPMEFCPADTREIDLWHVGRFPIEGILWGHPSEENPEKVREMDIAHIVVHRTMSAPMTQHHVEHIYCRADRKVDLPGLLDTRSPGEMDLSKDRTDGLRMTALLGLHKASGLARLSANARYQSLDIELDPRNGRVLSIRGAEASFGSMLARMPVEHRAHWNAIKA